MPLNNIQELEKLVNSELTSKIKKSEIAFDELLIETDVDNLFSIIQFLKSNDDCKFKHVGKTGNSNPVKPERRRRTRGRGGGGVAEFQVIALELDLHAEAPRAVARAERGRVADGELASAVGRGLSPLVVDPGPAEERPELGRDLDLDAREVRELADGLFQLPETATEGELLVVGEALVVKHQHRVLVHSGVNCTDLTGGKRLRKIDAGNLSGKARSDLANFHYFPLPA